RAAVALSRGWFAAPRPAELRRLPDKSGGARQIRRGRGALQELPRRAHRRRSRSPDHIRDLTPPGAGHLYRVGDSAARGQSRDGSPRASPADSASRRGADAGAGFYDLSVGSSVNLTPYPPAPFPLSVNGEGPGVRFCASLTFADYFRAIIYKQRKRSPRLRTPPHRGKARFARLVSTPDKKNGPSGLGPYTNHSRMGECGGTTAYSLLPTPRLSAN